MTQMVFLMGDLNMVTQTVGLSQFAHDSMERPELRIGSPVRVVGVESDDWEPVFNDDGITLAAEMGLTFTGADHGDTWVLYQPQTGPCVLETVYANLREFPESHARAIVQAARRAVTVMRERHASAS